MLSNIKGNTFKHYPKQISAAEAQQTSGSAKCSSLESV